MSRRPWRVHVRSVGLIYSFATEAKARARAAALVDSEYAEVIVHDHDGLHTFEVDGTLMRRTVYRRDRIPVEQELRYVQGIIGRKTIPAWVDAGPDSPT